MHHCGPRTDPGIPDARAPSHHPPILNCKITGEGPDNHYIATVEEFRLLDEMERTGLMEYLRSSARIPLLPGHTRGRSSRRNASTDAEADQDGFVRGAAASPFSVVSSDVVLSAQKKYIQELRIIPMMPFDLFLRTNETRSLLSEPFLIACSISRRAAVWTGLRFCDAILLLSCFRNR